MKVEPIYAAYEGTLGSSLSSLEAEGAVTVR